MTIKTSWNFFINGSVELHLGSSVKNVSLYVSDVEFSIDDSVMLSIKFLIREAIGY